MNTPISWIKAYVPELDVKLAAGTQEEKEAAVKAYVDAMTLSGSHAEGYELKNKYIEKVVVGKIEKIEQHPDADKLVVCQVNIGSETIQIVTGAPNVKEGDLVPTVLDGGMVPFHHTKDNKYELVQGGNKITAGALRGVPSAGMMCSACELVRDYSLFKDEDRNADPEAGVYIFPADADVKPGDDVTNALHLNDAVVEYEITSNRVDCFSMIGMARETAVTFRKPFEEPKITVKGNGGDVNDYASVEVLDTDLCKRYCARVVTDIKLAPSPLWMQERLRAQGIRPINNLVDITNYVMEEYGQPMHAFDLDTVAGHKIVVRRAKDGEKFTTLDGIERKLDKDVLMICDGEKEIGIAGIMGGENSMVTDSIKNLLFEAACFDGTNIRLSSRRLDMPTDAAGKFVKGLDPNLALTAINRACQLIEELDCGKVVDGVIDIYPEPVKEKVLPFEPEKMNKLLGTDISEQEMLDIFKRLELVYNEAERTLTIPTFRQDLTCVADLAEEVARFTGYDNIPVTLPGSSTVGKLSYEDRICGVLRDTCEANGFSGAMGYSFESPKAFDKLCIPADDKLRQAVTISNPLGEDFSIMRTVTLNGMMTWLSTNYNRRNKAARLYEIANVYLPKALPLTELPEEKLKLTLGCYGAGDFFDLKGVVEELLDKLMITQGVSFAPTAEYSFLHPGRTANINKGKLNLGYIGQVHPEVCDNYDIKADCYVAVLDLATLCMLAREDKKYTSLSKYPAITRDIQLTISQMPTVSSENGSYKLTGTYLGDIEGCIKKQGGNLLEECSLVDEFENRVVYHLSYRSAKETLEAQKVNGIVKDTLLALEKLGIDVSRAWSEELYGPK